MTDACKILVVDDDPEDQLILLEYFRDAGTDHLVRFLDNGQKAIDYLHDSNNNNNNISLPKLIVLDLNMPVLNGTQTLLQIKRDVRFKYVPIIIYSTSDNETEKKRCISFGAVDYVVKPSTYEEGQKVVAKLLRFLD
jgi:CheY-like chemotaxis protein